MILSGNRAVAYFDILGFKKRIETTPLEKISSDYERIIKQTDGEFFIDNGQITRREVCYRYIFSDSLFLIAKEDTEESFVDMFSYAWRMMQEFIVSGFALRGAISYGEVYANIDANVFVGQAIVDAAVLEGQQEWIGAVVNDDVIRRYSNIFENNDIHSEVLRRLLPIHDVPLKNGKCKEYHVINWRMNLFSEIGIKALFKNDENNGEAQKKIENTLRFSKQIFEAGLYNINDKEIPERYRKLFVGKSRPEPNKPFHIINDGY